MPTRPVAEALVAGDMVGQRTHGMALCPQYPGDIDKGTMVSRGEPAVVITFAGDVLVSFAP
jgi:LDH2 family malate/lactate/ureidoglycolate dehydrogenase